MNTDESPTPPPLPVPEDDGPSFYHKAAKYAVLVLVVGFVINLLSQVGSTTKDTPIVGLVISTIGGLFFLSAIPAGIIALVGIRKHGCSYLLWRGLVGILVPSLLLAMAIPAFFKVRSLAGTVQLQSAAKALNEGAPKMIDEVTRLEKATVGPGKLLTIHVTITSLKVADIDREVWNTQVVPTLKAGILASAITSVLRTGNTLTYRYTGSDGLLIDELSLTQADLPAPQ